MLEPIDQTLNSHGKKYFCYHIAAVITQNSHYIDQRKSHCKKEEKNLYTDEEREADSGRNPIGHRVGALVLCSTCEDGII